MTVGEFHDATRRALDLARQRGSHPVEDADELAETLATARMLFTALAALAAQLHATAEPGLRYQPWGPAVRDVTDLLPTTPQLIRTADPARAQHPLARTYLAAAAAAGLETDLLAAAPPHHLAAARRWLTAETLSRAAAAGDTLQFFAETSRRLHPATAYRMFRYADTAARAARAARAALPPLDRAAADPILAVGTRLGRINATTAALPAPLRPALGRLLAEGRTFQPIAPPDRGTLRGYARVAAAGSAAVAVLLEQAGGPAAAEPAGRWRAAGRRWAELDSGLTDIATLGPRNLPAAAAARDSVNHLEQLSQRPAPAPVPQRGQLLGDAAAIGAAVTELASQQRELVTALAAAGGLYRLARGLPPPEMGRWHQRLSPARWLPMGVGAVEALAAGYTGAAALVTAAADRHAAHHPSRQRAAAAVPLTALEQLARAHSRTTGPVPAPPPTPRPRMTT